MIKLVEVIRGQHIPPFGTQQIFALSLARHTALQDLLTMSQKIKIPSTTILFHYNVLVFKKLFYLFNFFFFYHYKNKTSQVASKLYGVNATIIIFVFILCCIVLYNVHTAEVRINVSAHFNKLYTRGTKEKMQKYLVEDP